MKISYIIVTSLFVLFGSVATAREDSNQFLIRLATKGAEENFVRSPEADLKECLRLLPKRLEASEYGKLPVPRRGGSDYVLFVSWGVGWDDLMFSYAAKNKSGDGVFFYEDEDGKVSKKLPNHDIDAVISGLSISEWKYSYVPGVQDGSCGLLVVAKNGESRAVLAPPGGQISSKNGDPRIFFGRWIDRNL